MTPYCLPKKIVGLGVLLMPLGAAMADIATDCADCYKCVSFAGDGGCNSCEYDEAYCMLSEMLYNENACSYFEGLYRTVEEDANCPVANGEYNALIQNACGRYHSDNYSDCVDYLGNYNSMFFTAICDHMGDIYTASLASNIMDCTIRDDAAVEEDIIMPTDLWYPGQYCYNDTERYIMYRCDCERDSSVSQAVSSQAVCMEVYGTENEIRGNCYLGSVSEDVYLVTNSSGETPYCGTTSDMLSSRVADYVCADTQDPMQTPEQLCACRTVWSDWGNDGVSFGVIRERPEYACGQVDWSTRCQDTSHNLSGLYMASAKNYNCTRTGDTLYQCSCPSAYYTITTAQAQGSDRCDCNQCPCVVDKDGIQRCGAVTGAGLEQDSEYGYFLGAEITHCGLSRGTFADDSGEFQYTDYCRWQN